MNSPMPQTVVDRIFAFMMTEKTGSIELHFRSGSLIQLKINETIRLGNGERGHDDVAGVLDSKDLVAQDLST
jgi:hypothetical protein